MRRFIQGFVLALLVPVQASVVLPGSAIRHFQATALETVAETTANVNLGDVNGDGSVDIVLEKGATGLW